MLDKPGTENGDRRDILHLAQQEFRKTIGKTEGEITSQLVNWAKAIGIPVHNRAELIDYLHKHPSAHLFFTENGGIQMATKRIMYNSDLTSSEKKAIRRYIESLPKETDTSKGLYYTDKKKGLIYWFNTSIDQYNDNRALGRDGFEIINKYDISKLVQQDKNAIDDELKQPKQSINRIITQFGLSQRINDDNIITLDYGEGEDVIDLLDKQSPASIRGAGDKSCRKNQREEFFLIPQGEIYGFMTKDGHMYLDENVIKPEHPIHEYTHLGIGL